MEGVSGFIGGERCGCAFDALAPDHHDRLRQLEHDSMSVIAELVDMAATWHELEYGLNDPVLGPDTWIDFALTHRWDDPQRVTELMLSLASLARPRRVGNMYAETHPPLPVQLASVSSLVDARTRGADR